jgi:mannose-1-phosphate guanylyltransferase
MLAVVDRPQLAYTFDHLRRHGVTRGIVSCGYLPTQIEQHFGTAYGALALEYRVEDEPLGTAGGIAFAARGLDGPFFALNGDSLREADLGALLAFHRERGGLATILLTPVADPGRYGLVRLGEDGRVRAFVEKPRPEEIDTNLINAGLYVLEPDVLELVPRGAPFSIERDVFPRLCERGEVYGLTLPGYWLDVGTPATYLRAHRDILERTFRTEVGDALGDDFTYVDPTASVHPEARLVPPVFVGAGAQIAAGARVGTVAAIGAGARIDTGAVVEGAVVSAGAAVGADALVEGSIVGEQARVGAGTRVAGLAVVGPGAVVGSGNELDHGVRVGAMQAIPDRALAFA